MPVITTTVMIVTPMLIPMEMIVATVMTSEPHRRWGCV